MLHEAVSTAAVAVAVLVDRPDGTGLVLRWGTQLDLRHIATAGAAEVEDGDGQISEARLAGGLRFHDLRHSYATWLVDDGVPPNMVHRVVGHERSSTTLDLYARRTDNSSWILDALNGPAGEEPDEDDPGNGPYPAGAPI